MISNHLQWHATSDGVKDDLLRFQDIGKEWCDEFTQQSFGDPHRFENAIKRR
jgi:hypothetical protein